MNLRPILKWTDAEPVQIFEYFIILFAFQQMAGYRDRLMKNKCKDTKNISTFFPQCLGGLCFMIFYALIFLFCKDIRLGISIFYLLLSYPCMPGMVCTALPWLCPFVHQHFCTVSNFKQPMDLFLNPFILKILKSSNNKKCILILNLKSVTSGCSLRI